MIGGNELATALPFEPAEAALEIREALIEAPEKVAESGVVTSAIGLARLVVATAILRSEEHTSELQSRRNLVCRLLLETKN